MKLWKTGKTTIFLLLMYMSTVCGEEPPVPPMNEEAYRLTAGWTFVLANQTLFGSGDLGKNPIFLSVYKVEDFQLEDIMDDVPVRILKPKEGRRFLGFLDLDRNTYSVVATLGRNDLNKIDVINKEYGDDALIGIQSSTAPSSGERFILKGPVSDSGSEAR